MPPLSTLLITRGDYVSIICSLRPPYVREKKFVLESNQSITYLLWLLPVVQTLLHLTYNTK